MSEGLRLFDTDHINLMERGGMEGQKILTRLRPHAPDDYGITIISYGENVKGPLAEVATARTPQTVA